MIADVIGAGGSGMSRPCSYNEAFNYDDITTNNLRCCVGSPRRQGMQFRAWARGSRHIGCY